MSENSTEKTQDKKQIYVPFQVWLWSILLTPIFGSYVIKLNSEELGKNDVAAKADRWLVFSLCIYVIICIFFLSIIKWFIPFIGWSICVFLNYSNMIKQTNDIEAKTVSCQEALSLFIASLKEGITSLLKMPNNILEMIKSKNKLQNSSIDIFTILGMVLVLVLVVIWGGGKTTVKKDKIDYVALPEGDPNTMLYEYAARNDLKAVKYLIAERGAEPTTVVRRDLELYSPLKHAIANNNLEMVDFLVRHGAPISAPEQYNLGEAIDNNYKDIVEYLIKHGADPTLPEEKAMTFATQSDPDMDMIKYLLKHKAYISDVSIELLFHKDRLLRNIKAAREYVEDEIPNAKIAIMLLKEKKSISSIQPLFALLAVFGEMVEKNEVPPELKELMVLLIEYGNYKKDDLKDLFEAACNCNCVWAIKKFVKKGFDVSTFKQTNTAPWSAKNNNPIPLLKELISVGANVQKEFGENNMVRACNYLYKSHEPGEDRNMYLEIMELFVKNKFDTAKFEQNGVFKAMIENVKRPESGFSVEDKQRLNNIFGHNIF